MTRELCFQLKEIREIKNMPRSAVYKELGISHSTIYNWEKGFSVPQEEIFKKWCKILGVEVQYKLVIKKNDE